MEAIFKIPQFSRQPQSENISRNYSMRRKKRCVIHEIISKTHWAASMWSYPYMFLHKALVFQANFLDSCLSSSDYISETNDRRATKICQGMGHDMATWGVDVESRRSKINYEQYNWFNSGCLDYSGLKIKLAKYGLFLFFIQ